MLKEKLLDAPPSRQGGSVATEAKGTPLTTYLHSADSHRKLLLFEKNIHHTKFVAIFLGHYKSCIESALQRQSTGSSLDTSPAPWTILVEAYHITAALLEAHPNCFGQLLIPLSKGLVELQADYFATESASDQYWRALFTSGCKAGVACKKMFLTHKSLWDEHFSTFDELAPTLSHLRTFSGAVLAIPKKSPKREDRHRPQSLPSIIRSWLQNNDQRITESEVLATNLQQIAHSGALLQDLATILNVPRHQLDPERVCKLADTITATNPVGLAQLYTNIFATAMILLFTGDPHRRSAAMQMLPELVNQVLAEPNFVPDGELTTQRRATEALYTQCVAATALLTGHSVAQKQGRLGFMMTYCKFVAPHMTFSVDWYFDRHVSPDELWTRCRAFTLVAQTQFDTVAAKAHPQVVIDLLSALARYGNGKELPRDRIISFAAELLRRPESEALGWMTRLSPPFRELRLGDEELETQLEVLAVNIKQGELSVDGGVALYLSQVGGGSKEFWMVVDEVIASDLEDISRITSSTPRIRNLCNLVLATVENDYSKHKELLLAAATLLKQHAQSTPPINEALRLQEYAELLMSTNTLWLDPPSDWNRISLTERDIANALQTELSDVRVLQGYTLGKRVSLDICILNTSVTFRQKPLVLQVDGLPYHFVTKTGNRRSDGQSIQRFDGNTRFKTAILNAAGFDVVRVPTSYIDTFGSNSLAPIIGFILHGDTSELLVVPQGVPPPADVDRPVVFLGKENAPAAIRARHRASSR